MTEVLSRTTLVIVVVCAVLAAVLVVGLVFRFLRATHRRPAAPLPPIQPLAHHRISKYDNLDSRPPSSIPDFPLPTPSYQSLDSSLPPPPSPSSSGSRCPPHPPPQRPISTTSLSSMSRRPSRPTLRGTPHAPSSQVQVILPTPLATTLSRPLSIRRDGESDHMSLADKWVPVGRNDSTSPSSTSDTPSSSRRISPSMSTSPSSFTYFQSNCPPPPVPPKPKDAINPPLTS